jgi:hypothetical protein
MKYIPAANYAGGYLNSRNEVGAEEMEKNSA